MLHEWLFFLNDLLCSDVCNFPVCSKNITFHVVIFFNRSVISCLLFRSRYRLITNVQGSFLFVYYAVLQRSKINFVYLSIPLVLLDALNLVIIDFSAIHVVGKFHRADVMCSCICLCIGAEVIIFNVFQ